MNRTRSKTAGAPLRGDQRGQSMMAWVIMMLVVFGGLTAALSGYTMTSAKATQRSADFVVASQLSQQAAQDAVYQFNQGAVAAGASTALSAGTACGSSLADAVIRKAAWDKTKLGCGVYDSAPASGKWRWTVTDSSPGTPGTQFTVKAEGAYGKALRSVTMNLIRENVSAVTFSDTNKIGYRVAPSTAFQHALFAGSTDTGAGLSWLKGSDAAGNVYINGAVGSNNLVDIRKFSNTADKTPSPNYSVPSVFFYNYGGASAWESRCNTTTAKPANSTEQAAWPAGSVCEPVVRAPQALNLNGQWVVSLANQCAGTPYKWVASKQGGTLFAGNGNSGCYTDMVFDKDTTIVGTALFSAFVSGQVTINPGVSIKATGTNGLAIYTNGSVTATGGGGAPEELDMYVYGPQSTCTFSNASPSSNPLKVVGSLACAKIAMTGVSAEWKQAPDGVDNPGSYGASQTYTQSVWFADSTSEGPSGQLS